MDFRFTGIQDQVEDILPRVRKPARYTGGEIGEIKKNHDKVKVLFALAFPDLYDVGMSNLGLKILYHILNRRKDTAAERVFAPADDMEHEMLEAGIPLYALESCVPIHNFNILGFSLAHELSYTNVLNMLDLAGLPINSAERNESHPLVIAGGHCTVNPEPMAQFIDAFVIGEGEDVVHKIVEVYKKHKDNRHDLLRALATIEGVYVPSLYRKEGDGLYPIEDGVPSSVKRTFVTNFEEADYPESFVVPFIETVHDRAALEIMRGCTRSCRFCQAGMITRPVRERSAAKLEEQAEKLIASTGYDEIGLMSLSSTDHSQIERVVRDLIGRYGPDGVGVSLPSIRADADCVRLAAEIESVRKTGLTFAPEAGTQRLRDTINKNVTEEDLLEAVDAAASSGWRKIKLYFMIGLPTETDEDVLAIAGLVNKVLGVARKRGKPLAINVGVSSFVPKPHTPFQWRAQDSVEELRRKIGILQDSLRNRSVSLSWHDTEMSELEAVLARGGRELGPAIQRAWELGACFDSWNERNAGCETRNAELWRQAFAETGVDVDAIIHGRRGYNDPLPWNHINCGVTKHWLAVQDRLADKAKATPDCGWEDCLNCGIKEFTASAECRVQSPESGSPATPMTRSTPTTRSWYRLTFSKERSLRWLSHLDLVRAFERAVRRARLPVAYSEGFNPRPRVSFYTQLAVGMTGEAELATIEVTRQMDSKKLVEVLNSGLPEGIIVHSAEEVEGRRSPAIKGSEYSIEVSGAIRAEIDIALNTLLSNNSVVIERKKEKETRPVDIRPGIESVEMLNGGLILRARLAGVRPSELIDALKQTAPGIEMRSAHRIKIY